MAKWSEFWRPFGFGRKKTFADRVQDVAEDVYDRFQDVAEDVAERVPGWNRETPRERAVRALASPAFLAGLGKGRKERAADQATDRVLDALDAARGRLTPVLRQSEQATDMAQRRAAEAAQLALARAARAGDTVSSGFTAAERASREAAAAAAARGADVAEATAGAFGSAGSFAASTARSLWSLTVFLGKAAILLGVAYAGWEWLQSRRQNEIWSTPSYNPPPASGPSGAESTFSPAGAVG
jgi:hypothetical protein